MTNKKTKIVLILIMGVFLAGCGKQGKTERQIRPTSTPRPTPLPHEVPSFVVERCVIDINDQYEHECGKLTVLEDRDKPNGLLIRFPVVIIKSTGDNPASDPLIYLPEGNGYSQLHNYEQIMENVGKSVLPLRDFIIFNQRGSELTLPHFFCPKYNEFLWEISESNFSYEELNIAVMVFWRTCHGKLDERELDLNKYASADIAADANDLRFALGYEQANYYATSYGTRIGLSLMRDFPENVRSLILDSVYPPQANYYSEHALNAYRAFNALFESCDNDVYCSEHYPNLRETFFSAVDQLNLKPVSFTYPRGLISVNGNTFMDAVFTNLSKSVSISSIPQMIYDAAGGDLISLEPAVLNNQNTPYSNLALYFSAQCREEAPFDPHDNMVLQSAELPYQITSYYGESFTKFEYDVCDMWKAEPADPIENEAVTSNVPTLIVSGQYDPLSPPEWGRQTIDTLENGYFFEIPGVGHRIVSNSDCALSIGLSFLEDPASGPQSSCLNELPQVDFELNLPVPRFESSGCYFPYSSEKYRAECGFLVVPEDRSQPDGRTIKLHVVIFKSTGSRPAKDPVIYVTGGGGGNQLDSIDFYLDNGGNRILRDRDYIMYNQRGSKYNHPSLVCSGFSIFSRRQARQPLSSEDREARTIEFLLDCYRDLLDKGLNLEKYNTTTNAADLNDLRIALGYDQVNLYGTSYGTIVILETLRDYPEGVRSAIIDSVYPHQVNLFVEFAVNAMRAFNAVFDDCAADLDCNTKYPNLRDTFYQIVDDLNAKPRYISTYYINGDDFMDAIYMTLYDVNAIPKVPKWIHEASQGKHSGLLWYYGISKDTSGESISHGVHHSLLCREEMPFNDPAEAAALAEQVPVQIQKWLGWPQLDVILCESWDSGVADSIETQPVFSDVPTLVFAGRYDPITPPSWSRLAAETLSNSFFYEFPANGHGVMRANACGLEIGLQFLNDPHVSQDTSCLENLSSPDFE